MHATVSAIHTGQSQSWEKEQTLSAIDKSPSNNSTIMLTIDGFADDQQADLIHHGGPDRAISLYPQEHYQYWRKRYPEQSNKWLPGAMGENLLIHGLLEQQVYIGDSFQLGDAIVQISQPRKPCWKINRQLGLNDLSLQMQALGMGGWLFRVLQAGSVPMQSDLVHLNRPEDSINLAWLSQLINADANFSNSELETIIACSTLSENRKKEAQHRLETGGKLANQSRRLFNR